MKEILEKECGKEYICPKVSFLLQLTEDVLSASVPMGTVGSEEFDNLGDSIDFIR